MVLINPTLTQESPLKCTQLVVMVIVSFIGPISFLKFIQ